MEIIENGVVYHVYTVNGIEIKEFKRLENSVELSYDGSMLTVTVYGQEPYNGNVDLRINGEVLTLPVFDDVLRFPYESTGYDTFRAFIEGLPECTLTYGTPPTQEDKIALMQQQIDELKTQNEQLIIMVGDISLGGI